MTLDENEAMKEELLKYKRGYSEAEMQKKKLEQSLHHAYNVSKMSREQMATSLQQIMTVSKKVIHHQNFEVRFDTYRNYWLHAS